MGKINKNKSKLSRQELLDENSELIKEINELKGRQKNNDRVFNLTLDMFCIAGFDGYFKHLNPAWEKILGWSIEELLSKPWLDFVHPDDKEKTENVKSIIVDGKEIYQFENRYIAKDGSVKWLSWNSQPFPEEQIMIGAVRDITKSKKVEDELIKAKEKAEESENQLRLIADNFANGMIYQVAMLDENRRQFNYISKNVKELYGCTVQEAKEDANLIYGKLHPDDIDGLIQKEKEALKTMSTFETEARTFAPDGRIRWAYYVSKPRIIDGVVCWDGIEVDITEKKKAEQKIKLNEARLGALVELGQMTSNTNEEIHNFTLNKAIELTQSQIGFLGFVNDDESEVKIYKWSDTAMKECAVENYMMNFIVAESGIWGDVIRNRESLVINDYKAPNQNKKGTPEGHLTINNYLSVPAFSEGKIVAIIAVANKSENYSKSDMHQTTLLLDGMQRFLEQRKEKEELIEAKLKAEESDRLKSAFLSNMSHEIRTPMNGILGFTELLQDADLSVENQKDYINIITDSGERLLSTVNDIVEISKIESGQIAVKKSEIDIVRYIDTQIKFFKPEAEQKGLNIVMQNGTNNNILNIFSDKTKLDSIVTNLIKNAIKYTKTGSIEVGVAIKKEQLLLSCKDSGIGIPKNRLEAIFKRFEQADVEDKAVHEGSGLGLAIVKSYAEMLGGKIWVESKVGVGSTFYVSLPYEPVNETETHSTPKKQALEAGKKGIKILIGEDDEASLLHLKAILKKFSNNIITAKDGLEAVQKCKEHPDIDVVLMDIKMPGMNGHDASKKIREFNNDIVIIAQTAYAFEEDKQKALEAGCTDYISKPIDKDELFGLINKHL